MTLRRHLARGLRNSLAVVMVAAMGLDPLANWVAERRISDLLGCLSLDGAQVNLGGWPVMPKLVGGKLEEFAMHVDSVTYRGLSIQNVDLRGELSYSLIDVVAGSEISDVTLEDASLTGTMTDDDLNSFLRENDLPFVVSRRREILHVKRLIQDRRSKEVFSVLSLGISEGEVVVRTYSKGIIVPFPVPITSPFRGLVISSIRSAALTDGTRALLEFDSSLGGTRDSGLAGAHFTPLECSVGPADVTSGRRWHALSEASATHGS